MSGDTLPLNEEAIEFFALACQKFEETAKRSQRAVDLCYCIGGHLVRMRFANSELLPLLTPALSHLETDTSTPVELTICIWDSDAMGTLQAPILPWSQADYTARGELRGYDNARVQVAFHSATLSMLDSALDMGVYWIRDAKQLTYTESGSPLLRIFHWWMRSRGKQLVHAGAVGTPDGGALLVGKGGSGKSTSCLLCLDSDLSYVGDDYCLVSTNGVPYAHSLYSSGKVSAQDISRFPFLHGALSNADRLDNEKALYFLNDHFSEKLTSGFPIRAILLPRVTGLAETTLRSISPSACLLALAPSTIFQLPGAGPHALKTLGDLVKRIPSYLLEVGTNLSQVPNTIANLLKRV